MRDCSQFMVIDGKQSMWQVGMRQSFSNGRHAESTETSEGERSNLLVEICLGLSTE